MASLHRVPLGHRVTEQVVLFRFALQTSGCQGIKGFPSGSGHSQWTTTSQHIMQAVALPFNWIIHYGYQRSFFFFRVVCYWRLLAIRNKVCGKLWRIPSISENYRKKFPGVAFRAESCAHELWNEPFCQAFAFESSRYVCGTVYNWSDNIDKTENIFTQDFGTGSFAVLRSYTKIGFCIFARSSSELGDVMI